MMSYNYQTQRDVVFTEEGQRMFLTIRDKAHELLALSGAVMSIKLMCVTGNVWDMSACIDRLVELGELREITGSDVAGQHRVFVKGGGW